jgi:hypothetical protein
MPTVLHSLAFVGTEHPCLQFLRLRKQWDGDGARLPNHSKLGQLCATNGAQGSLPAANLSDSQFKSENLVGAQFEVAMPRVVAKQEYQDGAITDLTNHLWVGC